MKGCWCFETVSEEEIREQNWIDFKRAAVYVNQNEQVLEGLSNEALLEFYSLGAQGWYGDNSSARPTGAFEIVEKFKWDSYEQKKGMPYW